MKTIQWALKVTVLIILTTTCKKDEDTTKITEYPPEATLIGTVTGEISSQSVGPDGGSVSSSDGKIEMIFPGGALTSITEISIQPVTNNAPGGIGTAYRFGPAGVKLNGPVTLKFHYNDNDVSGSLPMFLGMAVQKSDGMWYPYRHQVIDTIDKTVTVTSNDLFTDSLKSVKNISSNFLDHATFLDLHIFPSAAELKISESQQFNIYAVENHSEANNNNDDGDEDHLPPLPNNHEVSPNTVKRWLVNGIKNGNAEFGTVTPNGTTCIYKAPVAIPSRNPVDLAAEIKLWYKDPETGKEFNNLKINAPITIIEDQHKYQLKLSFSSEDYSTWAFSWKLEDIVTMDVIVTNGIVTINNIKNEDGVVTPETQTKESIPGVYSCTATVEEYKVGSLNITGGTGNVLLNDLDPNSPWLDLQITNNNWAYPKIKEECNHNGEIEGPFFLGGEISTQPNNYFYRFVLTNEIQTKNEGHISTTLTPKSLLPE
jgi:hypothetical protein